MPSAVSGLGMRCVVNGVRALRCVCCSVGPVRHRITAGESHFVRWACLSSSTYLRIGDVETFEHAFFRAVNTRCAASPVVRRALEDAAQASL